MVPEAFRNVFYLFKLCELHDVLTFFKALILFRGVFYRLYQMFPGKGEK